MIVQHEHKHTTHKMQQEYPLSHEDIVDVRNLHPLHQAAVGGVDVPGERPMASTARLLHDGARESSITARLMEERLDSSASMMASTLLAMTKAAEHKSKFKETVYKIRELVKKNPDFGNELREVLAPVRAVIRSNQDEVHEDDMYERLFYRPVDGGGEAVVPLLVNAGVKAEAEAGVRDEREVGCKGKADGDAGGERQRRPR